MLMLVACIEGGPDLSVGSWTVSPLVGDGLLAQGDCDLTFRVHVNEIAWGETCGRSDLPAEVNQNGELSRTGHLYTVGGTSQSTEAEWLTRTGDHPGLYELWVYPFDQVVNPEDFDADYVAALWAAE